MNLDDDAPYINITVYLLRVTASCVAHAPFDPTPLVLFDEDFLEDVGQSLSVFLLLA